MALFHLSVTQTKRSTGQSAIASAAYRAGERLYSKYYGEYSDYTRKGGVICSDILLRLEYGCRPRPAHTPGVALVPICRSARWDGWGKAHENAGLVCRRPPGLAGVRRSQLHAPAYKVLQ